MREHGEKLSDSDRKEVEDSVAAVKEALAGDDVEKMKQTTDALSAASQRFGQQIYEAAAQSGDAEGGSGDASSADDEVVDAEIVEDDEDDS